MPGNHALLAGSIADRVLPVSAGVDQAAPGLLPVVTADELAHPALADHLGDFAAEDPATLRIDQANDTLGIDHEHDDLGHVEVALCSLALLFERLLLFLALRDFGDQRLVGPTQKRRMLAPPRLNAKVENHDAEPSAIRL